MEQWRIMSSRAAPKFIEFRVLEIHEIVEKRVSEIHEIAPLELAGG